MRQLSVPGSVAADPGAFRIGQRRRLRVSHRIAAERHRSRASRSSARQAGSRSRGPPRGVPSGWNRCARAPMRPRRHEPPRWRRRQIRRELVDERLRTHVSAGEKPACGLDIGRRSLNLGPAGPYPRRGIIQEPPEPVVELWKGSTRCRALWLACLLACLRRRGRLFGGHYHCMLDRRGRSVCAILHTSLDDHGYPSFNAYECIAVQPASHSRSLHVSRSKDPAEDFDNEPDDERHRSTHNQDRERNRRRQQQQQNGVVDERGQSAHERTPEYEKAFTSPLTNSMVTVLQRARARQHSSWAPGRDLVH
jgi:hypothetical protein